MDVNDVLLSMLGHPSIASKGIVRSYDHEVRGGTLVRPFVGLPWTARPTPPCSNRWAPGTHDRFVLSNGVNPLIGRATYAMAVSAVDEASCATLRPWAPTLIASPFSTISVGATRDPPDRLSAGARRQGCYDAALAYRTPFISGCDSPTTNSTASPPRHAAHLRHRHRARHDGVRDVGASSRRQPALPAGRDAAGTGRLAARRVAGEAGGDAGNAVEPAGPLSRDAQGPCSFSVLAATT